MSDIEYDPNSMGGPEQPTEDAPRERERRARVLKKGKMSFQNGLRSLPCIIRNISENGALLEFEYAFMLPVEFDLHIDLEDFEVTCERRWEKGLRCGVQFISEKRFARANRTQTLAVSEEAGKTSNDYLNSRRDSPDNFFLRSKSFENSSGAAGSQGTVHRRPRTTGSSFGKRR